MRGTPVPNIEFNGPDSLWQRIKAVHSAKAKGFNLEGNMITKPIPEIHSLFYECLMSKVYPQEVLADVYPYHYTALQIFNDRDAGSYKWYIDALLLTNAEYAYIADNMGKGISKEVIRVYSDLFFDVIDNKTKVAWMNKYIWAPAENHTTKFLYYDYLYKSVAVNGGPAVFVEFLMPANLSPELERRLMQLAYSLKRRLALKAMGQYADLPVEHLLPSVEGVFSRWDALNDKVAEKDTNNPETIKEFMLAINGTIQPQIGMPAAGAVEDVGAKQYQKNVKGK